MTTLPAAGLRPVPGARVRIGWAWGLLTGCAFAAEARPVPRYANEPMWVEASGGGRPRTEAPDFEALAKRVRPSVVSITATGHRDEGGDDAPSAREFFERFYGGQDAPTKGLASGFVIRSDGYILTNEHVVESAAGLVVTLAGDEDRSYPATGVGRDDPSDLALIKIDAGRPLPVLALGDSDRVGVGQWVAAIGNPFGLNQSLTVGVVSYVGRRDINPSGRPGYYDFIQTDASINPGNSGGPLLDRDGRVVGISAAVNATGQGIGFAIPVNMAKDILPALFETGSIARSHLGISIQDLSPDLCESFGVSSGVAVTEVTASSPAARAGLRAGDVIVRLDGQPVRRAYRLRWLAATAGVGARVKIGYSRDGRESELEVLLEPMPGAPARFERPEKLQPRPDLLPLGFVLGGPLVTTPHGKGYRVTAVDPASRAFVAGLREGDVVLEPADSPAVPPGDLVHRLEGAGVTRLFVQRGLKPMFIAFRPEQR
jgi:serine protease Do